jgi:methionyl aminopeptidase
MAAIKIRTADEIEKIKIACKIVAKVREKLGRLVKPGITSQDIDRAGDELIREQGAEPLFKGYRGYSHSVCVSINEEIVHGIPGKRVLTEGDIVSIDVGARINGYCGDTAATFAVGRINKKAAKLLRACEEALYAAIKQARGGNYLGDVSAAVERVAKRYGYSVVRELYGHGIGTELHEDPLIPNYGEPGSGPQLKSGMVLCIEPMLNIGTWKIETLSDGWTVVTQDRQLSSHFEHQILVTDAEAEILTK